MAGTNDGENGTTRRTARSRKSTRKSTARGRRTGAAAARRRQRMAIARGSGNEHDGVAEQIVEALNGVGFLRPMNVARRQHVKNLVDLTLRGVNR